MIISKGGQVIGMGSAPELAVDALGIIRSILDHDCKDEIIENMIQCDNDCDTHTMKELAEVLIKAYSGITA